MKRVLGILTGVGLALAVAAAAGDQGGVFAQRPAPATMPPAATAGTELIVVPMTLGEKGQMLTVVDPRQRVLGVYHIDAASGRIALKSVRNIRWDLQIDNFNNDKPLPQEIRSSLEQK
jgi:hypothetical protein